MTPTAAPPVSPAHARRVLVLLLFAYILNFLDRQILGILAQPIKADLGLSDTEFGAIGGLAFALLYSVLGVPLAILADRTSRSGVIAASLAVWSAFTALCGAANSFMGLFLARLGVGVGEAGGVAPSYALIADHFPPRQRARALAIFSLGVPLGLAFGTLAGAYIAANVGWRTAFVVMGVIGLAYAPIFKWLVKDPPRPHARPTVRALAATLPQVMGKPLFWLVALAASSSSLVGYGLAVWLPSILMRSHGLELVATGQFMASLLLLGGVTGVIGGGILADRLGQRDRRWYLWLPAIAWAGAAPLYAAGLLIDDLRLVWLFWLIPNALNILWLGPITTAVQHLVAQPLRATASGAFLLVNNFIGLGLGPLLIGAVSERLKGEYGPDSLRYAALAAVGFYLLAALLAVFAARRLRDHWVEENEA